MEPGEPIRRSLPSEITGDGKTLRGLIPYNVPAKIFDRGRRFVEVIRPGAFARALVAGADVIATYNHDVNRLLGRTSSGTLALSDSAEGLRYALTLPDAAADVRELLARGDLRGSSFTAYPAPNGERWAGDRRELLDLVTIELGPVVMPAYPTSAAFLRDGGPAPPTAPRRFPLYVLKLMERT